MKNKAGFGDQKVMLEGVTVSTGGAEKTPLVRAHDSRDQDEEKDKVITYLWEEV